MQKVAYDFYKDSNIAEVVTSAEVLKKIAIRANTELELYPEHAGLLDVSFAPQSLMIEYH